MTNNEIILILCNNYFYIECICEFIVITDSNWNVVVVQRSRKLHFWQARQAYVIVAYNMLCVCILHELARKGSKFLSVWKWLLDFFSLETSKFDEQITKTASAC